jgi:hypothetical protein
MAWLFSAASFLQAASGPGVDARSSPTSGRIDLTTDGARIRTDGSRKPGRVSSTATPRGIFSYLVFRISLTFFGVWTLAFEIIRQTRPRHLVRYVDRGNNTGSPRLWPYLVAGGADNSGCPARSRCCWMIAFVASELSYVSNRFIKVCAWARSPEPANTSIFVAVRVISAV